MKGQNNNMSLPGDKPTLFESNVCGRCGGTGHYSYNTIHGSRCFGCGGRGRKLTKRGLAAQNFYNDLMTKVATEVEVGDKFLFAAGPMNSASWVTADEVKVEGERVHLSGANDRGERFGMGVFANNKVRIAQTAEAKREAREKALAFQATLTKTGKPRKSS
jgi:hypothetical protein